MHYSSLKAVKIWADLIGNCPRSFEQVVQEEMSFKDISYLELWHLSPGTIVDDVDDVLVCG